jgi:hypothetical protein
MILNENFICYKNKGNIKINIYIYIYIYIYYKFQRLPLATL